MMAPPAPPPEEPAPEPETAVAVVSARPAWRTVHQRPDAPKKKARGRNIAPEPAPAPPPPQPIMEQPRVQAWANWKRPSSR